VKLYRVIFNAEPNRTETKMKWNLIEGDWLQLKGSIKRQWPKLSNVDVIIGKRERLARYIEQRYSITAVEAERQLAGWQGRQLEVSQPA
jgi:uncharacterized protein YjbJ (UPF0337 family)